MLVPHYMLKGIIRIIKAVKVPDNKIEKHYQDEHGQKAVIIMQNLKDQRQGK